MDRLDFSVSGAESDLESSLRGASLLLALEDGQDAPDEVLAALSSYLAQETDSLIEQIHFFPLGGIKACADWANGVLATAEHEFAEAAAV